MINIYIVIGILFLHWLFDFVLQTDKQGKQKSSNFNMLLKHTATYSLQWISASMIYVAISSSGDPNWYLLLFGPITFVCHTITDYYTSRVGKQLLEEANITNNHHSFFVNIGFDQWLHQAQLILTFYLLS